MSHSQFHCTSRAYLDMHGLIFETSICYWQDQPGRCAVSRRARRAAPLHVGRTCRARESRSRAPEGARARLAAAAERGEETAGGLGPTATNPDRRTTPRARRPAPQGGEAGRPPAPRAQRHGAVEGARASHGAAPLGGAGAGCGAPGRRAEGRARARADEGRRAGGGPCPSRGRRGDGSHGGWPGPERRARARPPERDAAGDGPLAHTQRRRRRRAAAADTERGRQAEPGRRPGSVGGRAGGTGRTPPPTGRRGAGRTAGRGRRGPPRPPARQGLGRREQRKKGYLGHASQFRSPGRTRGVSPPEASKPGGGPTAHRETPTGRRRKNATPQTSRGPGGPPPPTTPPPRPGQASPLRRARTAPEGSALAQGRHRTPGTGTEGRHPRGERPGASGAQMGDGEHAGDAGNPGDGRGAGAAARRVAGAKRPAKEGLGPGRATRKTHGDPTATDTKGGPATPGTPAGLPGTQTFAASPPRPNRVRPGPRTPGNRTRPTPQWGGKPSVSRTETAPLRPGGCTAPRAPKAAHPMATHSTRRAATRDEGGRGAARGVGAGTPGGAGGASASPPFSRRRPPRRTPARARRDPPPTRRGEARAAADKRHSVTRPLEAEQRGRHAHDTNGAAADRAWEGRRLGGPVPQGTLSDR